MVTTPNIPTAMASTIIAKRPLIRETSRSTFRQRGLTMNAHLRFRFRRHNDGSIRQRDHSGEILAIVALMCHHHDRLSFLRQ